MKICCNTSDFRKDVKKSNMTILAGLISFLLALSAGFFFLETIWKSVKQLSEGNN
jgi:hypothetical protein